MTRKSKNDDDGTRAAFNSLRSRDPNALRNAGTREHQPWKKGELPRRDDGAVAGQLTQRRRGDPALNPPAERTERMWTARQLREKARRMTPDLFEKIEEIANDEEQPAAARLQAASIILDRGYGKAAQPVEVHQGNIFEEMDDEDLDGYILDNAREFVAEKRADGIYEIAPGGAGKPKKEGK